MRNAGYVNVPCAYLKTELDVMTPIQGQETGIAMLQSLGTNVTEFTIKGGHDAFLGQPKLCASYIMEFAAKCVDDL